MCRSRCLACALLFYGDGAGAGATGCCPDKAPGQQGLPVARVHGACRCLRPTEPNSQCSVSLPGVIPWLRSNCVRLITRETAPSCREHRVCCSMLDGVVCGRGLGSRQHAQAATVASRLPYSRVHPDWRARVRS
eukprot:XP_001695778.1 predicted protein [Chlamydomonas reinhardtii]